MKFINCIALTFLGLALTAQAEITPLKIDKAQNSPKYLIKFIKSAHEEIKHQSSIEEVRFAILTAGLSSGSIKWLLEEDGGNYLLLRWDYGRAVIYTKVEFDEQYIQLKFEDSFAGYECKNNQDGVCYKNNDNAYYDYLEQLRNGIIAQLSPEGTSK